MELNIFRLKIKFQKTAVKYQWPFGLTELPTLPEASWDRRRGARNEEVGIPWGKKIEDGGGAKGKFYISRTNNATKLVFGIALEGMEDYDFGAQLCYSLHQWSPRGREKKGSPLYLDFLC